MFVRLLSIFTIALSAEAYANSSQEGTAAIQSYEELAGIWAMVPLKNGIANVVEYSADGTSTLHPFNCIEKTEEGPVKATYTLENQGKRISVLQQGTEFDLDVTFYDKERLQTIMQISGIELTFTYIKRQDVASLCHMFK
ncbi:hypothetical protein [Terasakiella pusilla]|uniref:hypothetical protein n=1 Tax=Terasakiella pusilla TaxID=64973 RepID=UPI003AA898BC